MANDFWNNPPETDELPECCGEFMDCDENGNCSCPTCGKQIPIENYEEQGDALADFYKEEQKYFDDMAKKYLDDVEKAHDDKLREKWKNQNSIR